ncbi:MAG: cupin domain-containing protein [Actinomycetota bacterium]|nr:cupin domain-containing protein [Actinomycetota bacterium]
MGRLLGGAAAIFAWLAWLAISPALSFPTLDPGGMLNRVFAPKQDPGFWIGQLLMLAGLMAVAAAYFVAAARVRLLRERAAAGLAYGFGLWLIVGAVVMPIIGLISPGEELPPTPPGTPPPEPDFMQATVMMHHLGVLAPVGALIAWLLLGAVLGATSALDTEAPSATSGRNRRAAGMSLFIVSAAVVSMVDFSGIAREATLTQTIQETRTTILARASVEELPPAPRFVSVLKFPQPPGSTVGPHDHVAGVAYALRGATTIEFERANAREIERGEAIFIEPGVVHDHESRSGRAAARTVALGLVVLVLGLFTTAVARPRWRRPAFFVLTAAMIVVGALAIRNPWTNEYFFIAVRPDDHRGGTMTVPNGTHHFESPRVADVPLGPYVETLREVAVGTGRRTGRFSVSGPNMLLVLDGRAEVRLGNAPPVELDAHEATLVQSGEAVEIVNPGEGELRLLSFTVTSTAEPLPVES